MTITPKYGTNNMTAKANRKIEYIVIHYTAGVTSKVGSAANTCAWYADPKCVCSSDFTVDDYSVMQYNADIKNRYTRHCGGAIYKNKGGKFKGKCTNANSIGIEICSTNSTGKMQVANDKSYSFTAAAVNNAAELVRYLMKQYNIPAENVVRHYDCTGKLCPGIIGWNADSGSETAWNDFKKAIGAAPEAAASLYCVQLGAFMIKKNAESSLAIAKKSFPDAFIKKAGDMYLLQIGAFRNKDGADKLLSEVRKKFPDAYIKIM